MPYHADGINQVLDEAIGLATEVYQARRRLAGAAGPSAEAGQLAGDLARWMALIVDVDAAAGRSPLETVTTPAGRARQPWPASTDIAEVLRRLTADLDKLGHLVAAARKSEHSGPSQAVLDDMLEGIQHHLGILRGHRGNQ